MSHSKSELSVSERLILDYITFRTRSGFPFFEKNNTIAPNVGLTESTTKELINRLVRKGYLFRCKDERNRRQLLLTEMTHTQTYTNFAELTKANLQEELDHQRQYNKNMERDVKMAQDSVDIWRNRYHNAQNRITELEQQIAELQSKLNTLQSTKSPQINNTTTIKKDYPNNNESIVRVDNISVEGNLRHNNDASNTANTDVFKLIDGIMSKYKIQKSN